MKKQLSEMSNEELWQLFPIIITEHNLAWSERFEKEKDELIQIIGVGNIVRINHIGSTAVPGLVAKPTIDILVEISQDTHLEELIHKMENNGYIYSPQPNNPAPHMLFMKGYTTEGFKGQAFHVHVRYPGNWDELYFRDYLIGHPEAAEEYGKLKLKLKECYEHDRDGYTHAKTDFIRAIVKLAKSKT